MSKKVEALFGKDDDVKESEAEKDDSYKTVEEAATSDTSAESETEFL